ncbi:Hypothetical protein HVR_LOCUS1003 [uncultured virus]|nr:Hypothetical protein HVR_LOCUS1003 [uncultured virus]
MFDSSRNLRFQGDIYPISNNVVGWGRTYKASYIGQLAILYYEIHNCIDAVNKELVLQKVNDIPPNNVYIGPRGDEQPTAITLVDDNINSNVWPFYDYINVIEKSNPTAPISQRTFIYSGPD